MTATALFRDLAGSDPFMAFADAVLKSTALLVVALAIAVCGKRFSASLRRPPIHWFTRWPTAK